MLSPLFICLTVQWFEISKVLECVVSNFQVKKSKHDSLTLCSDPDTTTPNVLCQNMGCTTVLKVGSITLSVSKQSSCNGVAGKVAELETRAGQKADIVVMSCGFHFLHGTM